MHHSTMQMLMRLSVLLTFLVALAQSSGSRCKDLWKNQQDFNAFSKKHILSFDIRRNWNMKDLSKEFEKYLQKHGLCGRVPLQTFFGRCDKNRVEKICNGQGFEDGPGNLCISEHRFTVYLVESRKVKNRCKIQKIDIKTQNRPNPNNLPMKSSRNFYSANNNIAILNKLEHA
ncbi:hypothetical protein NFI96_009413 [Prochilodus magdalenae]|nr:hypothetical protein NFI96_009413 [Prochilodus magdalenae]